MGHLEAQFLDLEHQVGNHEHLVCPACLAIDITAAVHADRIRIAESLEGRARATDSDSARSILLDEARRVREGK